MKKYLLFFLLFYSQYIYSVKHSHSDEYEVRYINSIKSLNSDYQQFLRGQNLWRNYLMNNNDWFVIFNEQNQLPHRAFGKPILLTSGNTLSEKVINFLEQNNFPVDIDLELDREIVNDKYKNLNFKQYFNSIEIINSNLYAKLTLDNKLVAFGLDIHNNIELNIIPNLSVNNAIISAKQGITARISKIIPSSELKILPIPGEKKFNYHLVYEIYLETRIKHGPANYICYIDANTGDLLMRRNTVMYEAPPMSNTHVEGEVYTTHPFNPTAIVDLVNLKVKDVASGTNYFTDSNGDITFPSSVSQVEYKLEGLYSEVKTNGVVPSHTSNVVPSNFSFDNHSTIQERTAYFGVNMIHSHFKSLFPTFTGLDFQMETNVDEAGSCNAFYNGSVNFYAEGNGCPATAKLTDVVYHEYGHAINSYRYGSGMINGALNEGFADIWALSITQSPVLGYGWDLVDPTVFVRRYDENRKVYPQDISGEVHADGEIIAGAFWDTYLNLGSMSDMLDLFKYVYDGAPQAPNGDEGVLYTDVLIEVLYADDNDADLTNGTPNDISIVQAFALHGISLLSNAEINHIPIQSANANTSIPVDLNLTYVYPWDANYLSAANCYYKINNNNSWSNVTMTQNSNNFQALLPSQPNGTIISYYLEIEDIYGVKTCKPMASNTTPLIYANLPYYTLVGYDLMEEEDFDFNVGFWQAGDINDNATTGMWEIGVPMGSYLEPMSQSGIVQTANQHTLNGFQCAFTENASNITSSIGESDIDNGHTTLYSPLYDLSSYTNPAFSYWRWYTNNTGAEPNADWWQVQITDDGVNWVYVENTLTSDISWRKFAFRAQDFINPNSSQVQLRFIASDSAYGSLSGGSLVEAALDDLYLYESKNNQTDVSFETNNKSKKLVLITDVLGREIDITKINKNLFLIYIYSDGTIMKKLYVIEH